MPLLMAISAFGYGEDAGVLLNSVIYTVSVAYGLTETHTHPFVWDYPGEPVPER